MKTFSQFLTERSNEPAIRSIVRSLLESNVDPVRYTYLRLVEALAPGQAAAAAPAQPMQPQAPAPAQPGVPNPGQDIKALTDQVNKLVQAHAKTSPEMGKLLANMQREAQGLQAAAQKDAQAKAATPVASTAPIAPAAPAAPAAVAPVAPQPAK